MADVEKKVTFTALMKGFDKAIIEVRNLQKIMDEGASTGRSMSDALEDLTKGNQRVASALTKTKGSVSDLNTELKTGTKDVSKNVEAWSKWAQAATKFRVEAEGAARAAKETAQGGQNYQNLGGLMSEGVIERRNSAMEFSSQLQQRLNTEQKHLTDTGVALDANMAKQGDTFRRLNAETGDMAQGSLPRLRYALYDVSTTLAVAGAAMLGLATATAGVSIAMDRQFADVLRTTESYMDSTGRAGRELRRDFDDLFTSLPISWSALTEIGTLAGQLGVASEDVTEFTELVAKFGATSDVSVEQAATAFGRLSELLDVPATKYENLGSSILAVGIASVATEGQIISTTTQLASIGNFAGLSASEVIGLSSALASLGTQPELARGTMTRLFTKISEAVSEGGEKLQGFASVSQMTASDFADAWQDEPIKAIEGFLAGLGTQGDNAVASLKELGITSARDIPTLLRLGQNAELVSEQIRIAGQGFDEGTALQDQYGVVAETVASKLEVMKNSVQNLFGTLGEGANALGPVIDLITGIINALNSFLDNPVAQAIAGITLGFTALAGILTLLLGGVARGTASMAAMMTALHELTASGAAATLSLRGLIAQMNAAGVSTRVTTVAVKGLRTALISSGVGAVLVAIGLALSYMSGQMDEAIPKIRDSEGRLRGLAQAIQADTKAWEEAGSPGTSDRFRTLTEEVETTTDEVHNNSDAINTLTGANLELEDSVSNVTKEVVEQTVALSENSEEWLRNDAAQTFIESLGDSVGDQTEGVNNLTGAIEMLGVAGVTQESLSRAAFEQNTKYLDQVEDAANRMVTAGGEAGRMTYEQRDAIVDLIEVYRDQIKAIQDFAQEGENLGIINKLLGSSLTQLEEDFEDVEGGADTATSALQEFMEMAFGAANAEIAMNQAMNNLGASLYENGTAFDTFSEGGQANLQALQAAFQAAGEQAVQDGHSYELGINTVAQAMVQAGIISVQQLEALGIQSTHFGNNLLTIAEATSQAVAELQNQQAALMSSGQVGKGVSTAGDYLSQSIVNLNNGGAKAEQTLKAMGIQFDRLKPPASAVNALVDQLGQGWDNADQKARKAGGSGSKAAKDTAKAAKDAAKEVRTLSDYVSDLGSVMSAAFDFRFGFQESKDDSLTAFRSIQKSFEDARLQARDLRLEIRDLKAEIGMGEANVELLTYQLSIATQFGDTMRETQIVAELEEARAKLAKQDADLTDKQKELTKAQKAGTPDVTSNTEAAVEQRDAVLALAQSYQEQIEQYAATGASQQEVEKYSRQLQKQFEDQLLQLGYNREETRRYGEGLKDFTQIIKEVPRDLTVNVNAGTGPAEKAIREFTAKKRSTTVGVNTPSASAMKKAGQSAAKNFKSGLGSPKIDVRVKFFEAEMKRMGRFYKYTALAAQYNNEYKKSGSTYALSNAKHYADLLRTGQYYDGGYTGRGGKYDPAGIVHRGEYVVKKELVDQRTGLPKADAFGQLVASTPTPASGYANGGFANSSFPTTVDLSPMSAQMIARAVQPYLVVDGQVVGEITSNQYAQGTRVGAS